MIAEDNRRDKALLPFPTSTMAMAKNSSFLWRGYKQQLHPVSQGFYLVTAAVRQA